MAVDVTTIDKYFSQIYKNEGELQKFYNDLNNTLLSYKFPLKICLSSNYVDGTLLGTLQFQELNINGYPKYIGDVVDEFDTTYGTELNFNSKNHKWTFTLSTKNTEITINSIATNNINPTKVDYEGISRPTAGACKIGGGLVVEFPEP
jgi:hypothetical protein